MSWLRIDDGFAQHPKIVRLTPKDRWTWIEVLCYCARYRTAGAIPEGISQVIHGATPAFLNRCYELGLLDLHTNGDGSHIVHDWADFNPKDLTAASRKQAQRERDKQRDTSVTNGVTETVTDRDSRVSARARSRPVPSLEQNPVTVTALDALAAAEVQRQEEAIYE